MFKLDKKVFRKSSGYKRQTSPFVIKLICIFRIIKDRNFILITGIKEFSENGEGGREVTVIRRTDYGGESDYLSCLAGAEICMPDDIK